MKQRLAAPLALVVATLALAIAGPAPALASATTASFVYPTDGATNVDTTTPFSWTTVAGAQSYYLYVGTTKGAKDLVDSYSTALTSYRVPQLPSGQTLWGRIWTQLNGKWTYEDISFTAAPVQTAQLTFPADGAQNIDPATPFAWGAVSGAAGYKLQIGTAKGSGGVLDSGTISTTSYQVTGLPTGQTLWARLSTLRGGNWTSRDSSFTAAAPSRATLTYPRDGATDVDTSKDFAWNSVPGAEGYYLYVGTSKGAKDLVDSNSTQATSYSAPPLPTGQTLWARVWTKVNGSWSRYSDVSFKVTVPASRLTYPTAGQTNVDTRQQFKWAAVPEAGGYYLKIGTTPGGNDLFDSGTTQATSMTVPPLPVGQTLYARLHTKLNGNFNTRTDTSFKVVYSAAKLTYPLKSASPALDTSKPFTWTPVPGASGYSLWIGTTQGGSDVLHTSTLSQPIYSPGPLPAGAKLWARIWTLSSGNWVYASDVQFTPNGRMLAPAQRSVSVDPSKPFSWAPGAVLNGRQPTYQLTIGTSPGAKDKFDSGVVSTTSVAVPQSALPPGQQLYARVVVNLGDGSQRDADTVFAVAGGTIDGAQMDWGSAGSGDVDTSDGFQWNGMDLAQAYRLQVLDGGGSTVADSGEINVPRYFAETLPAGSYTARLGTKLGGQWVWRTSPFTVTHTGASMTKEIDAAHWAVNYVRHMSDTRNDPYAWTTLYDRVNAEYQTQDALCNNYSYELVSILKQMNVTARMAADKQPRVFNSYFDHYDGHTMVEFWNADNSNWIVLDATFDFAMKRTSDGEWATVADAHQATVSRNWGAITYVPLGEYGYSIANAYAFDYPLIYLNPPGQSPWLDPLPYWTKLDTFPSRQRGTYAITSDQNPVTILVDGAPKTLTFSSDDPLSKMFLGSTIALPSGSTAHITVYRPNRFVF